MKDQLSVEVENYKDARKVTISFTPAVDVEADEPDFDEDDRY